MEDSYNPVVLNGKWFQSTVRATTCELLVAESKCTHSRRHCSTLHALHQRRGKVRTVIATEPSNHTNLRYLTCPEKLACIRKLKAHVNREKKQRMSWLKGQLAEKSGVEVDESLYKDLEHIMKEMTGYVREELTQDLLNIPGVKCLLSGNHCQDPLEGVLGSRE